MSRNPNDFLPDPEASKRAMIQLDAYLDGQLAADDRARFETMLASDPVLREHVNRQREIDYSLQRMFIPPALIAGALLERMGTQGRLEHAKPDASVSHPAHNGAHLNGAHLNGAHVNGAHSSAAHLNSSISIKPKSGFDYRARPARSLSIRRPFAVAAALFFLLLGPVAVYEVWQAIDYGRQRNSGMRPASPLEESYENEVPAGFQAQSAGCDAKAGINSPRDVFLRAIADQFQLKLEMVDPPKDVELTGAFYSSAISVQTVSLLAQVDKHPIELFVDSELNKPTPPTRTRSDLHLFQRQIKSVIVYEMTPLDHPTLLGLFSDK